MSKQITLHEPMMITARLMPGIRIGTCTISFQEGEVDGHRQQWTGFFDFDDGTSVQFDDYSCLHGRSIKNICADWLDFLYTFAESRSPDSNNFDLFPASLRPWAETNSDELSMLAAEFSEEG